MKYGLKNLIIIMIAASQVGFILAKKDAFEVPWPITPDNDWRWFEGKASDDEIKDIFSFSRRDATPVLSTNDIVQRMQATIDRLHERLMQIDPEHTPKIPKPIVKLDANVRELEAHSSAVPVCFPVKSEVDGNLKIEERSFPISKGVFGVNFWRPELGLRFMGSLLESKTQPKEYFDQFLNFLESANSSCRVQSMGANSLELTTSCYPEYGPMNVKSVEETCYFSTLNVIMISDKMLNFVRNESEADEVVLHEAAHYYGGHASTGREFAFNYFYNQDRYSGHGRPVSDDNLKLLGEKILEIGGSANRYRVIRGQVFDSSIDRVISHIRNEYSMENAQKNRSEYCKEKPTAQEIISYGYDPNNYVCEREYPNYLDLCGTNRECVSACTPFFNSDENDIARHQVERTINPNEGPGVFVKTKKVKSLESLFVPCARLLPMSDERQQYAGASVSAGSLRANAIDFRFSRKFVPTAKTAPTLYEFIRQWEAIFKVDARVMAEAAQRRVGYYTMEQEADRMSVQFALMLGIDPASWGDLYLRFMKEDARKEKKETSNKMSLKNRFLREMLVLSGKKYPESPYVLDKEFPSVNETTYAECVEMRGRGKTFFLDDLWLPIDNFADEHHSGCLRVQLIDRGIRALRPRNFRASTTLFNAKEWHDFLENNGLRIEKKKKPQG